MPLISSAGFHANQTNNNWLFQIKVPFVPRRFRIWHQTNALLAYMCVFPTSFYVLTTDECPSFVPVRRNIVHKFSYKKRRPKNVLICAQMKTASRRLYFFKHVANDALGALDRTVMYNVFLSYFLPNLNIKSLGLLCDSPQKTRLFMRLVGFLS